MFKCPLCHSNSHTLPTCPLMKNWTITKKRPSPKSDDSKDTTPLGTARSAILSSSNHSLSPSDTNLTSGLTTIDQESESEDLESNVEFDLLAHDSNQDVTTTSGNNFMYSDLMVPLGSVFSTSSSYTSSQSSSMDTPSKFDVIINSGCTRHMMPYCHLFIS